MAIWKLEVAETPPSRYTLTVGGVCRSIVLSVHEAPSDERATVHLHLSLCELTDWSAAEARRRWPAAAIAAARRLLDELEEEVGGEQSKMNGGRFPEDVDR